MHKRITQKSVNQHVQICPPGASLEIGPQRNIGISPMNHTPLETAQRAESSPLKSWFLGRPEVGQIPVWKFLVSKRITQLCTFTIHLKELYGKN